MARFLSDVLSCAAAPSRRSEEEKEGGAEEEREGGKEEKDAEEGRKEEAKGQEREEDMKEPIEWVQGGPVSARFVRVKVLIHKGVRSENLGLLRALCNVGTYGCSYIRD